MFFIHKRKCYLVYRLRKVKMDQRKLMDNANTITDMAKVNQNLFRLEQIYIVIYIVDTKYGL